MKSLSLLSLFPDGEFKEYIKTPIMEGLLKEIEQRLYSEYLKEGEECIFPPLNLIFNAFSLTPLNKVKVVILGQDPYHGQGEAHGLAFSVPNGIPTPPSLRNIFKELESDLELRRSSPDLTDWAENGVLLLNKILTVKKDNPKSHEHIGWQNFTRQIISYISAQKSKVVFILWGSFAQSFESLIDADKHLVIKSPHPSPLSAYRGFFGSKPFSKAETFLGEKIFL